MLTTFMGLTDPYDTTWADGRSVTVFPSGKVVDRSTGYIIRRGSSEDDFVDSEKVRIVNPQNQPVVFNNQSLMFMIIGIVAIVAIVAITNGKR